MSGKSKSRRDRLDQVTAADICEALFDQSIQRAAQAYGPAAIDRIAEIAESGKDGVALRAAKDLIDRGHGRKMDKLDEALALQTGDITINLITFGEGGPEEKEVFVIPDGQIKPEDAALPEGDVTDIDVTPEDASQASERDPLLNLIVRNPGAG